jgi:hypothetical protein
MAPKNGRSGAKTKGKSAAGLAAKNAFAEELVTPQDRAELLQAQAHETFLRELPALLENRSGQCVAYRGKTQLAVDSGKTALLQKCLRRGFDPKELLVRRIHPGADEPPTLFEPQMPAHAKGQGQSS